MTSLRVISGLAPPIKNPGYAYAVIALFLHSISIITFLDLIRLNSSRLSADTKCCVVTTCLAFRPFVSLQRDFSADY